MLLDLISDALERSLTRTVERFIAAVKQELEDQGHVLTGTLRDSIRYEVTRLPNTIQAIVFMKTYGENIDKGVKPGDVPFNPGSGAKSSKYIDGLQRFWMLKGLDSKEALSAAFATAKKHKKEGMPTRSSYDFSKNGKRTGFFTDTLDSFEDEIANLREESASEVSVAITNVLRRTVKEFETIKLNL